MEAIRVVRGLGGNGGTYLARAIAAMKNVVVLSETNPLSANLFNYGLNPAAQIESHYRKHAFSKYAGPFGELGAPALFGQYIASLTETCRDSGLNLVIRDYNYADYIGLPFVWPVPGKSSLNAALEGSALREILLIRHPLTQFASLQSHELLKRAMSHSLFLEGYRCILQEHPQAARFKYEDVFEDFEQEFPRVVASLDLQWDPEFSSNLPKTNWITGNATGKATNMIEKPRQLAPERQAKLRDVFLCDPAYSHVCEVCGYEP